MKNITLLILSMLLIGSVFARHHKRKKDKQPNSITSVSIHRTACYGRCPDYLVQISNDGTAIYTGKRFTADTGIFKKNIGTAKAMEVINEFYTYRVDTCSDMYRNRIPDLPGLIITVQYKDSTKTIRDANFGPSFLKQLANDIDAAGKKTDDTWQKTGMPEGN